MVTNPCTSCQGTGRNKVKRRLTLKIPKGVSYIFAGAYENQVRATKRLSLILPLALLLIFLILHFEFRSVLTTAMVFSGVFVAHLANQDNVGILSHQ